MAKSKSLAQIRNGIIDLSGPVPAGVDESSVDAVRKTLAWTAGQYGDEPLLTAVFGVEVEDPSEPAEDPGEPAEPEA